MSKKVKDNMCPGVKAFCGGVEELGEQVFSGFGSFITECVKRAMEERGLKFTPPTQPKRKKSNV